MSALSAMPKRRAGRPARRLWSVAEVAALLELPEALVRARCLFSFFPGSWRDDKAGDWVIPDAGLVAALRGSVEPHYAVKTAATLLDVSYHALHRVVQPVARLSDPLAAGKRVRAVLLSIGTGAPVKRIPESELRRWLGLNKGGSAA